MLPSGILFRTGSLTWGASGLFWPSPAALLAFSAARLCRSAMGVRLCLPRIL